LAGPMVETVSNFRLPSESVRPVTSIAIAVLLGFILLAFVVKLASGGLTP